MLNQTAAYNSYQTNSATISSIDMPSQFTSTEARYYQQLFQDLNPDSKPSATNSFHAISNRIRLNFEKTVSIDDEGVEGLCQLVSLAEKNRIDLTLSKLPAEVKMILSLIGLEDLFAIAE